MTEEELIAAGCIEMLGLIADAILLGVDDELEGE